MSESCSSNAQGKARHLALWGRHSFLPAQSGGVRSFSRIHKRSFRYFYKLFNEHHNFWHPYFILKLIYKGRFLFHTMHCAMCSLPLLTYCFIYSKNNSLSINIPIFIGRHDIDAEVMKIKETGKMLPRGTVLTCTPLRELRQPYLMAVFSGKAGCFSFLNQA